MKKAVDIFKKVMNKLKIKTLFGVLLLIAGQVLFAQTVVENFDGTYPVPGWDCDSVTRVDNTITEPHSAPYCAMFNQYTNYMITSLVVDPGTLSFWHKKDTGNASPFLVQVSTSINGPWTTLATISPGQTWAQSVIDLSAYDNIYIAWTLEGPPPPQAKIMYFDSITWVDNTLPVELSSFTGVITTQNNVMLQWTTQSETNVSGYYIFRNYVNNLSIAERINAFIPATNTSQEANYVFIDNEAITGNTYYYWLQHIDLSGEYEFHGPVSVHLNVVNPVIPIIPLETKLREIYPNPFAGQATISYSLAKTATVELVIMNAKGQIVRHLQSANKNAGNYRLNWNGLTDNGFALTSGIYFVRMTAENKVSTQKLVLVK